MKALRFTRVNQPVVLQGLGEFIKDAPAEHTSLVFIDQQAFEIQRHKVELDAGELLSELYSLGAQEIFVRQFVGDDDVVVFFLEISGSETDLEVIRTALSEVQGTTWNRTEFSHLLGEDVNPPLAGIPTSESGMPLQSGAGGGCTY